MNTDGRRMQTFRLEKDHIGSILLIVLGALVMALGIGYRIGSLRQMGAGFAPVVLGALMILIGLMIGLTAAQGKPSTDVVVAHASSKFGRGDIRGWICVLGGVVSFVVLGRYGGMIPASFVAVFVSALGDRQSTVKSAAILAAVMTVFGVVVFYFGLQLQLPLFQWG